MGARSAELARQFEVANREFTETVEACSEQDWTNLCPDENWTVGVTAHHVAYGYPLVMDVLQALEAGEQRPITMQMIDELNADHAKQYADCTYADTMFLLKSDGEKAAKAIRELPDGALDTRHNIPLLGEEPVTMEFFIQALFIGHHGMHLPSIRNAAPSTSRERIS